MLPKQKDLLDFNSHSVFTPTALTNSLAAVGLDNIGRDEVYSLIRRKSKSHVIDSQCSSRMRKKVNALHDEFFCSTGYMIELEEKIKTCAFNFITYDFSHAVQSP